MEKRTSCSFKAWFRISLLSSLFTLQAHSFQLERYGFDLGVSGSVNYSDIDDSQFSFGSGYQASIFATFDIQKDYSLKLQFDSITLQQDALNNIDLGNNISLVQIQQRYHLILVGIEKRQQTWFWEAFGGLNLGRESSYEVKDNASGLHSGLSEETKTFLVAGAAIAYHWQSKKLKYIARLKTFSLLSNVYDEELGDENFYFSLPLLLSLGMEF